MLHIGYSFTSFFVVDIKLILCIFENLTEFAFSNTSKKYAMLGDELLGKNLMVDGLTHKNLHTWSRLEKFMPTD